MTIKYKHFISISVAILLLVSVTASSSVIMPFEKASAASGGSVDPKWMQTVEDFIKQAKVLTVIKF